MREASFATCNQFAMTGIIIMKRSCPLSTYHLPLADVDIARSCMGLGWNHLRYGETTSSGRRNLAIPPNNVTVSLRYGFLVLALSPTVIGGRPRNRALGC